MIFILKRTYHADGTNGTIYYQGVPICHSIELPWRNNERGVSCIPEGVYELKLRFTDHFGRHYLVKDVPGRTMILVHPFNHAVKESRGCIAPVETISGPGKGYGSRAALDKLLKISRSQKGAVFLEIRAAQDGDKGVFRPVPFSSRRMIADP